jgi:Raf kinase inhibitor-like YbhB/YbcL family protein
MPAQSGKKQGGQDARAYFGSGIGGGGDAGACGVHSVLDKRQKRQPDVPGARARSCNGQNISPALNWSGEPAGTQSFALTMVDTDARSGRGWWHWSVFNIPASVHGLAAGTGSEGSKDLPVGAIQGRTDFGFSHYGGPCPPVGEHAHHYEITVYALKVPSLPLDETALGAQVGSSLGANTLATAKIVGRYGRSK